MEYAELHAAISNARRIQVISDYPLLRVITAPGHHALRNPASVAWIAQAIDEGRFEEVFAEPILIGIFTDVDHGSVRLRAIECLDGHHRLLAGLQTGAWRVIGDIPEAGLDTRVNGWRADGAQAEPRWIPLEVAQRSRLAKTDWSIVPPEWGAKGPTAMIPGEVCGLDTVFSASDRSIPFQDLVESAKR